MPCEEQLKTVEETLEQYQKQLEELQEKAGEAKVQYKRPEYSDTQNRYFSEQLSYLVSM